MAVIETDKLTKYYGKVRGVESLWTFQSKRARGSVLTPATNLLGNIRRISYMPGDVVL